MTSLQASTYSNSDSISTNANYNTQTLNLNFLKYTVTSDDTNTTGNKGLYLSMDILSKLLSSTNEFKFYILIINGSSSSASLKVRGCSTSTCATVADIAQDIGGGSTFAANEIKFQEVSLINQGSNFIQVTVNGHASSKQNIYYGSGIGDKFYLQFTFDTVANIKISFIQINMSKSF